MTPIDRNHARQTTPNLSSTKVRIVHVFTLAALTLLLLPACTPSTSAPDPRVASMQTPYYSPDAAVALMREDILAVEDPVEQRRRFELNRTRYGVGHARGMLMSLTVARHPNAAASLENLGELEPDYEKSVSQHVLADMIAKFDPADAAIDAATVELLTQLCDASIDVYNPIDRFRAEANDYLALACMNRLLGKGHDELILRYIDNRLHHAEHHGAALREIKQKLATE